MVLCTQIGALLRRHNQEINRMTNSTVQTFIITSDMAELIREGAAKERSAKGARKKAAEAIAAEGGRGHMFTKDGVKSGLITKETFAGLQGLIASGLLTKPEFALWAMDSKAANKAGKQTERNKLTSEVNTYLAGFRGMIETAWAKLNPDLAKAEADADAPKEEKEEKEEKAPVMAGDVRAQLKALILEVAGMDCENRDEILQDLNHAESLMTW
jgi:hypothetical protein